MKLKGIWPPVAATACKGMIRVGHRMKRSGFES
jgi:hypothetical protein